MGVAAQVPTEPEFEMCLPYIATYHDLNSDSDIPALPFCRLNTYYLAQDKPFEDKYKMLYDQR